MKNLRLVSAMLLCGVLVASAVGVRAEPAGQTPRTDDVSRLAPPTVRVTVVLSRVNGEKKIANLPFVLMITADERPTQVQMSSEVPIPVVVDGKSSFQYRSIGTNMNATAKPLDGGQFIVALQISDSQMLSDAPAPAQGRVQNFSSSPRLVLRDGQTIQYAAATDKTTGDVVKVDVTLNVVK